MSQTGERSAGNLLVGGIRTNFEMLGPGNLPVFSNVDQLKSRRILKTLKDAFLYHSREVQNPLNPIREGDLNPVRRKWFHMRGADHAFIVKLPVQMVKWSRERPRGAEDGI